MYLFEPVLCILLCGFLILGGCSKKNATPRINEAPIQKVRDEIAKGDYENAIRDAKEITNQVPPGSFAEEAYYLNAYAQAFGRSDFQGAKLPLKQLLGLYPAGKFALSAQKLLADCQYWMGHYQTAGKEYKILLSQFSGKGLDSYALFQSANCLMLDDKVSEALSTFHELTDKYPMDPLADSAQLIIANSYLKMQNYKKAKSELQKLISFTHDKDVQQSAQKALHQIEEDESFKKVVGSSP